MHQQWARRARCCGVQIVAHHDVGDALPGKGVGQSGRSPARREEPLHGVQCPDRLGWCQRNGIPYAPGEIAENLQWLIVSVAPYLVGERSSGNHQHPAGIAVLGEPVGGLVPVTRDHPKAARRSEPTGPGQGGSDQQCGQHDDPSRHPLVGLRMGDRAHPFGPGDAAGQWDSAEQMNHAEHQWEADHRFELLNVAQRRTGSVQKRLHLVRQRRPESA